MTTSESFVKFDKVDKSYDGGVLGSDPINQLHPGSKTLELSLDARRVQHHSARARDRVRRQVLLEVAPDDTVVAMRLGDLAPDSAVLAAVRHLLRPVHVHHPATDRGARECVWSREAGSRFRSPATQRCWLLRRHTGAPRHEPAAFQGGRRAGTS